MKKIIVIVAIVLFLGLLVVWNFFSLQSDKVGLQDDGVYFGMNQFELFMKKGEDYETSSDPQENTAIFTYDELILLEQAKVSYEFHVGGSYSLRKVTAVIETGDRAVFDKLCDSLIEEYSKKAGESSEKKDAPEDSPTAVFEFKTKPASPQHVVTAEQADGKITVILQRNYESSIIDRFIGSLGRF